MSVNTIYENIIIKATETYCSELLEQKDYKELTDEYLSLYNELLRNMPIKYKGLLLSIMEKQNNIILIQNKTLYKKGLQDGLKLKDILNL